MRITQWGEYGVHCAVFIAQKHRSGEKTVTAADIANSQTIAIDYAQQILQRLRKSNIIESVRGPQGGYKLARPATEITLYDILVAAEGSTFEVICETKPINSERCAPGLCCSLRPIWYALRDHVNSFLTGYTLDKLMDAPPLGSHVHDGQSEIITLGKSAP